MQTQTDILKAFCPIITAITSLPCVLGDQDQAPPKGQYVCVRMLDMENPIHDVISFDEATQVETVRGQSYCNMEVLIFGNGAMDNGKRIINGLQTSARQFDVMNNIGFGGFTGPQNLSEGYGGQFRQRALVNVEFYANFDYTNPADWFETVDIQITDPDILDVTITVPPTA